MLLRSYGRTCITGPLPQAFYRLADTSSGTRLRAHGARPGDTAIVLARKLVGRDRFVSLLTHLQGEARPIALELHVAPLLRAPPALPPLAQLVGLAAQLIARGAVAALVDLGRGARTLPLTLTLTLTVCLT